MGKIIKTFPKLYGKTSVGKIKEWEISVIDAGNNLYSICTKHGLQDGKKQADVVIISEGKNIGRSNETTPKEQAISEAQAKWNKKNNGNYSTNIKAKKVELPMLAKSYKDNKHHIKYPCYVQPKLDGVRCLAKLENGNITFTSRNGKSYETIEHIGKQLLSCMNEDEILDGEIYIHNTAFQDLMSAIKNVKNKDKAKLDCNLLEYWIYDIANPNDDFNKRLKRLNELNICGLNIIITPTYKVKDEKEMLKYHKKFTEDGYEGTIIRNIDGKYKFNYRSNDLQKYKDFLDEEYKIIGVKKGVGRFEDCGTFICITEDGIQFDVLSKGTMDERKEYLTNKNKYMGMWLKVKFQEKSSNGKPRFPIGIGFRIDEDLPNN